MKARLFAFLLLAASAVASEVELPVNAVTLFARLDTDHAAQFYQWEASWGSFIRDQLGTRSLYVNLHRAAGPVTPVPVVLEVIFTTGFEPHYQIIERQVRTLSLTTRGNLELYPICGYENTETRLVALGEHYLDGKQKPTGWAVRVWQHGRVIAVTSHLPELAHWLATSKDAPREPTAKK